MVIITITNIVTINNNNNNNNITLYKTIVPHR